MQRPGAPGGGTPSGLTPEAARARRTLREGAAALGVRVSFGEGRRTTDVTLVVVKGPRLRVMRSLPKLVEPLGLDVEVVRSATTVDGFEIVLALMVPKARRPKVAGERRASELGDGET
jgi:hypothetical protein